MISAFLAELEGLAADLVDAMPPMKMIRDPTMLTSQTHQQAILTNKKRNLLVPMVCAATNKLNIFAESQKEWVMPVALKKAHTHLAIVKKQREDMLGLGPLPPPRLEREADHSGSLEGTGDKVRGRRQEHGSHTARVHAESVCSDEDAGRYRRQAEVSKSKPWAVSARLSGSVS